MIGNWELSDPKARLGRGCAEVARRLEARVSIREQGRVTTMSSDMGLASTASQTRLDRPFHIMTKPIGPICNLDCEYCYYLEKQGLYPGKSRFRMSEELLETYVKQYIEAQPGPVVPFAWQGGEPTLMGLQFFEKVVELQRKYLPAGWRCTNALQTNGTLLTPEWCKFFRENEFLVGISLDGPAELHDRYRLDKKQRPTHAKVMEGLRLLQEHGVEYNVLCVVNRINVKHPLEVYRFFKEHGVRHMQFIPLVEREGADGVSHRTVPAKEYGLFLAAIFDEWIRHDIGKVYVQIIEECFLVWLGHQAQLCVFRETCGRALAMEHNGDLFSCDHFVFPEYKLGNITETPLSALVASAAQAKFGAGKKETLPRYCLECEVRFMCNGGCPKDRFIQTPDGEPGLNYLCEGYRYFFNYVDPYMKEMVALWRRGEPPALMMELLRKRDAEVWARAGRNDPCPCGSGRKYKKCCLGKAEKPVPGSRAVELAV